MELWSHSSTMRIQALTLDSVQGIHSWSKLVNRLGLNFQFHKFYCTYKVVAWFRVIYYIGIDDDILGWNLQCSWCWSQVQDGLWHIMSW